MESNLSKGPRSKMTLNAKRLNSFWPFGSNTSKSRLNQKPWTSHRRIWPSSLFIPPKGLSLENLSKSTKTSRCCLSISHKGASMNLFWSLL
jgi:hypothetical protein